MVKRGNYWFFIFSFIFFLNLSLVSANFVCGRVHSLDNSSDISSAWMHVKIYYPENVKSYISCQVSPDNGKYCCDPSDIKGATWAVGKTINAELNELDFSALSTNLVASGNGYDIFPDISFEKAINLIEPNTTIYLNVTSIHVLAKSAQLYNNINYTLRKNDSIVEQNLVCANCTQVDFYLNNLSSGNYELSLTSYNTNSEAVVQNNFTVLTYLNFRRSLECVGCSGFRVPAADKNITVIVTLNASDPIQGKLSDLFPADMTYQGDLLVDEITDSHDAISWDVNGKDIQERYVLNMPQNLFNSKYIFQSSFDSFLAQEDTLTLSKYRLFDFASLIKKYYKNIRKVNLFKTIKATNSNPVVINPVGFDVTQVAIFPNVTERNVVSFVKTSQNLKLNASKSNFLIWSSINASDIDKVLMQLKIDTKSIKKNQNARLYYYDSVNDSWGNIAMQKTSEDEKYLYYQAFNDKLGVYSILIT
jgi:hypothetical protein